ncbi:MAG: hypothetical protein WA152_01770 [Microgenomates group bacterium]
MERINNINYFVKTIPFLGSVLKIQRPKAINFDTIQKLENKHRVFQTIIEPDLTYDVRQLTGHYGFKLSKNTYLPSKTIYLRLNKPINDIYRNFSKDCKYSIRKGEGLVTKEYSTPAEIKKFHEAWKKSVNFKRYVPSLENLLKLRRSFPQSKSLFLASHNKSGSIIGGAIFTISSHDVSNYIIYYWQGFTNQEGRTSLSQYSLLYQGILWGKKMGCKTFDFEGIYDERFPNKSWLGFTHFKKSFGGTEILYLGCYTKFRLPI